jgi:hypothetical protein
MQQSSRRNFIKKSARLSASAGIIGVPFSAIAGKQASENMFVHHVYFWLKEASNQESKSKLLKGLKSLQKIETIKLSHVGVPSTTNRDVIDTSYAFSLLLIFNNLKDQETYQTHPVHLKFVEECSMIWSKVIVYDSVNA